MKQNSCTKNRFPKSKLLKMNTIYRYTMTQFLPHTIMRLTNVLRSQQKSSTTPRKHSFRNWMTAIVTIVSLVGGIIGANAQITNLKFDTEEITYSEISGGTTVINGGSALGAVSALTPIGFNFQFQGNTYGNISVNAAGLLKFGAVIVTNESANNASSIVNTPKLYAWWDATYTVAAANGGGVSTLLTGSAPNRVLTIQWKVAYAANAATGFSYQIKLYETSNKIEYLYGIAPTSTPSSFRTMVRVTRAIAQVMKFDRTDPMVLVR